MVAGATISGDLSDAAWLEALRDIVKREGTVSDLGAFHSAVFVEKSRDVLFVAFETVIGIRAGDESGLPLAFDVCDRRGWSIPTVKTLLSRLVAKGALATQPDGRRFLYTPTIARAAYVGTESRRLVERLFGGRAAPLFAHLAEAEALTSEDIAEIERLLAELKK